MSTKSFILSTVVQLNKKKNNVKTVDEQKYIDKITSILKYSRGLRVDKQKINNTKHNFIKNILPILLEINEPKIYDIVKIYNIKPNSVFDEIDNYYLDSDDSDTSEFEVSDDDSDDELV